LRRRGQELNKVDGWDLLKLIEEEIKIRYNHREISAHQCLEEDAFRKEIWKGMVGFTLTISGNVR